MNGMPMGQKAKYSGGIDPFILMLLKKFPQLAAKLGMGGGGQFGMTRPPSAPSYADLVNPLMNQANTPMGASANALPYGREQGGELSSVMLPPGEGANPSFEQNDVLQQLLPLLRNMKF